MTCYIQNASLILASRSPRREELLRQAGLRFSVIPSPVEEKAFLNSDPATYVRVLAEEKADWVAKRHPESWIIGADTVVVIDNTILEKPNSKIEARDMLRRLSGRMHLVFTGYAVRNQARGKLFSDVELTEVTFKPLNDAEIEWYASTSEPYDKAGGYAIQGLGSLLIRRVNGSYTCVVGLPVCEVMDILLKEKIIELSEAPEWTLQDLKSTAN